MRPPQISVYPRILAQPKALQRLHRFFKVTFSVYNQPLNHTYMLPFFINSMQCTITKYHIFNYYALVSVTLSLLRKYYNVRCDI